MRIFLTTAALASLLVAGCSSEQTTTATTDTTATTSTATEAMASPTVDTSTISSATATPADNEFAMKAASGGLAEVALGQLAIQKAESPDVKSFGQRMVTDHGMANSELQGIAAMKNISLPATPDSEHTEKINQLSALSGREFDKAYMAEMVKDHQKDVGEFEKQSTGGSDPELKAFASKTLPILKDHLRMAEDLAGKVGAP